MSEIARDVTVDTVSATGNIPAAASRRVASLDVLRGAIIVLMALDHARAFIARNHPSEFWGSSLPDYQGDWLAFLTRLVTHLCAPGFMFLMGAGTAFFGASRLQAGWTPRRVTFQLVLRGIVLIAIGLLLENTAAAFGSAGATRGESYGLRVPGAPGPIVVIFGVLFGLGSALAVAALVIRLPPAALAAMSLGCVTLTHWLTPGAAQVADRIPPLLGILVVPGIASPILAVYPTLPWLGPTLLGLAFGKAVLRNRNAAFAWITWTGIAFLACFVALRATGSFGSLHPVGSGWIAFFNVTKYPPSLTFLLLTLGVNFVLLSVLEYRGAAESGWLHPLRVFGGVPLFFFVTHLWLYALVGRLFPAGTTILRMYPVWLLGLLALYLPCRWYLEFKANKPVASIFRLL